MTQSTVLSPVRQSSVVDLGGGVFRKQLLPVGSINYKGRRIDFTRDYLATLLDSFKNRAYDAVKLMLPTDDGAHTDSPEKIRGDVVGLDLAADGLDMLVRIPDEATAQRVRDHPNLGVSARIVEQLERSDGRTFPAAIKHVCMTIDPRVTGMRPWQAVDLANPAEGVGAVIDLSDLEYEQTTSSGGDMGKDDRPQPDFSDPETVRQFQHFQQFMEATKQQPQPEPGQPRQAPGDSPDQMRPDPGPNPYPDPATPDTDADDFLASLSDDELTALYDGELADADLSVPAEVQYAIDLAQSSAEQANARAEALEIELAKSRFEQERTQLVLDGVPPALIDLARPVLESPAAQVIDLAGGSRVDVADVLRNMLHEAKGYIDLARTRGYGAAGDEPDVEDRNFDSAWAAQAHHEQ